MYLVRAPLFTKAKEPVGEFVDVPMGVYEELRIDEEELVKLIAQGQITKIEARQVPAEDESEDEDIVTVNEDEIEVPVEDDELVVLVVNDTVEKKPSKAKVTKTGAKKGS